MNLMYFIVAFIEFLVILLLLWGYGARVGFLLNSRKNREEILIGWVIRQMNSGWHGCATGDCPHDKQDECNKALREQFEDHLAALADDADVT